MLIHTQPKGYQFKLPFRSHPASGDTAPPEAFQSETYKHGNWEFEDGKGNTLRNNWGNTPKWDAAILASKAGETGIPARFLATVDDPSKPRSLKERTAEANREALKSMGAGSAFGVLPGACVGLLVGGLTGNTALGVVSGGVTALGVGLLSARSTKKSTLANNRCHKMTLPIEGTLTDRGDSLGFQVNNADRLIEFPWPDSPDIGGD